jgi:hypothetical protein
MRKELWIAEHPNGCLGVMIDNVLYQGGNLSRPTVFLSKSGVLAAIRRTVKYSNDQEYNWDKYRPVRFTRG